MGLFFIDTSSGQVATQRQLMDAGIANDMDPPPRPWHQIQGPRDATTMWYSVLRKRTRGIVIGTLAIRHSDNHASLLADGWEDVPMEELREGPEAT